MANFVVFEDFQRAYELIEDGLLDAGHTIVDHQITIQGAFGTLRKLLQGEIQTDFLLIDASLKDERRVDPTLGEPEFIYEHPGEFELHTSMSGLFRRRKQEVWIPKLTNFKPDDKVNQKHGRVIVDIARQTGIAPPVRLIGISGDGMRGIDVDHDADGKNLNRILESVKILSLDKQ